MEGGLKSYIVQCGEVTTYPDQAALFVDILLNILNNTIITGAP